MNTLVAKEIRQLRPAFVAALLLAAVPAWLYPTEWNSLYRVEAVWGLAMPLFCIGWLLLALTCFGREFGMGTFPVLLALPVPRQQIWWTKIAVLLCAMMIVLTTGVTSACLWFAARTGHLSWPLGVDYKFGEIVLAVILTFVVIAASGLWTTLFLRQTLAAFWFAMVVPLALLMLASWGGENVLTGEIVLGIYAVAGFLLAQRLFYRAQEVAWTGGEVNLPALRSAGAAQTAAGRNYHPLVALLGKELQLYKIPFAGMTAMFVLHLGAILLRWTLLRSNVDSQFAAALSMFGGLWFLIPLVTAGISISEERRMGTLEGQLCQPFSQRLQFVIKLILALLISGLLCGSLLWLAEYIGTVVHAGSSFLVTKDSMDLQPCEEVVLVFLILSFVVFFASTLARSLLQAIATAILMGLAILLCTGVTRADWGGNLEFVGGPLLKVILSPALLAVSAWLAYTNFRRLAETRRTWWRTIRALLATFLIATALTALIFFRSWEYLTPLEPAHGPARLSLGSAPRLQLDGSAASVFLPDGQLWSRLIGIEDPKIIRPFGYSYPVFLGEGRWITVAADDFEAARNWSAFTRISRECVAICADGTLWLSERMESTLNYDDGSLRVNAHKPVPMVRFGQDVDWEDVAPVGADAVLLLKRDGTLWLWGSKYVKDFPGLGTMSPMRMGTDSDWARMLSTSMGVFLWKKDGKAWHLIYRSSNEAIKPGEIVLTPDFALRKHPVFDQMEIRSFAMSLWTWLIVRENGTLWTWDERRAEKKDGNINIFVVGVRQVGNETNWVSVAANLEKLLALKNNGTLWRWNVPWSESPTNSPFDNPPERLGTHNDWVALAGQRSAWALAADGSLWSWNTESGNPRWLTRSRKPDQVSSVFSK